MIEMEQFIAEQSQSQQVNVLWKSCKKETYRLFL